MSASPRQQRDLDMMADPSRWPGRILCLKKPGEEYQFADLYRLKEGGFRFIPTDGEKPRTGELQMLVGLIEEGWVVD